MTNKNIGASSSFMSLSSSLKLDLDDSDRVWISSDSERNLAQAIADVTEGERELQRISCGKGQTLLTDEIDLVDMMHWDELLQSPNVVMACAKRAGVSPLEVLEFVTGNCRTSVSGQSAHLDDQPNTLSGRTASCAEVVRRCDCSAVWGVW